MKYLITLKKISVENYLPFLTLNYQKHYYLNSNIYERQIILLVYRESIIIKFQNIIFYS